VCPLQVLEGHYRSPWSLLFCRLKSPSSLSQKRVLRCPDSGLSVSKREVQERKGQTLLVCCDRTRENCFMLKGE